MKSKNPPYEITNPVISDIAAIAELIGRISTTEGLSGNPTLRRRNRIRSIHGSLAIEQNTLNLEQVTAVLNGKAVIAPPKDIAEVRNAYEIYGHLDRLDPYSVEDLLKAHHVMMRGLIDEAGDFRSGPVGVVDQSGQILHFGTLPQYVPKLVCERLDWAKETDTHPLIKGCVFHYEFELIHPFSDGNGRMGRLWHTLMLSKWNPLFAWLPVESIIHERQQDYYRAINRSNAAGESTAFLEFMLSAIKASLIEAIGVSDGMSDAPGGDAPGSFARRRGLIEGYLKGNETIQNAQVRSLCGVSAATANRLLNRLVQDGMLQKYREKGRWVYRRA